MFEIFEALVNNGGIGNQAKVTNLNLFYFIFILKILLTSEEIY
jgi:hypothetical protein